MERCCKFTYKFKKITWTKWTMTICMIPFILLLLLLVVIVLCTMEQEGAVVSNSGICTKVGQDLLSNGGSAVDAAIGIMLCEGIALPYSAGIGGGFSAIMRIGGRYDSIIATPTFPEAITRIKPDVSYSHGAKAVGVPGEIMGYWELHNKYGMLSWKDIFEPSIKICQEGVPINNWFSGLLGYYSERLETSPTTSKLFPKLDGTKLQNEVKVKFPTLAETLKKIADNGASEFYGGDIGKAYIEDIQNAGGILTLDDLRNYKVLWNSRLPNLRIKENYKLYSTPPPAMGAVIVLILNCIKSQHYEGNEANYWHNVVMAMRHAFNYSLSIGDPVGDSSYADVIEETYDNLTDPEFARTLREAIKEKKEVHINEDMDIDKFLGKSASSICILAPNGDIVASTTSLLETFGAFFYSSKTGIISNNLFNRFIDEKSGNFSNFSKVNRPLPNKHFLTAPSQAFVTDSQDKPIFLVGSSGGARGVTLMVNAIIRYVFLGQTATEAVSTAQLHHRLHSNQVECEEAFDAGILNSLRVLGHKIVPIRTSYDNFAATNCIGGRNARPEAQSNIRIGGSKSMVRPNLDLSFILVALVLALTIAAVGVMLYEVFHPRASFLASSAF